MTSKYKPVPTRDELMGRTPEEYQRLRRQAKVWEPATMRVLRKAGLRKGMSCLDVGCGPGEVMRLMGKMVGTTGQVTGLDYDGKAGRQAIKMLQATAKSHFTFIEQDIETAEDIPGQPFDLTYARFFLLHARDPITVLRKMYAWTKPGGCIVVQDFNAHTGGIFPKVEFLEEIEEVISRTVRHGGKDLKIGHKLPVYFIEAGIGDPDGTDVAGTIGSLKECGWLVRETYLNLLPRAIQMGLTTETESKTSLEKLSQAERSGRHYSVLLPSVIGVWKHKPLN